MTEIERIRWTPPRDWSQAYDNRAAVGQSEVEAFIARIEANAKAFRAEMSANGQATLDRSYGDRQRQRFDLFLPKGNPTALAVFVHGGYWRSFDKSSWSHLAAGALARNAAVAIPSYTLCPEVKISDITKEIASFLRQIASEFELPIRIAGHSAGGHLVTRIICGALDTSDALDRQICGRIEEAVSISGVHDLRPLLKTAMNEDLRLNPDEARAESPLLLEPIDDIDLTCWVGRDETQAFRLQNLQLAQTWGGLGAQTEAVEALDRHHFSVVEDLADTESALVETLMG